MAPAPGIGLTQLYNTLDAGGYRELAELHGRLDEAAVACYGWPRHVAQDPAELLARLAERNDQIVVRAEYVPFAPLPPPGPRGAAFLSS
jgi:hypothetical protein